jgi:DNA-binding transcriptional LysR family regulator
MTTILERTTGLVAFVRTIESGSFSAASRLVGSSQSAISKSVAALERRLGVKLIQRSTRTLSLTAEGQAYYERVAPLLRAIEDAEDVVQAAATARGPIRVAASQRLTENELSDFSRLWHDGCVKAITEAQDVDRNHSAQV